MLLLRSATGDVQESVEDVPERFSLDDLDAWVLQRIGWRNCTFVNNGRVLVPGEQLRLSDAGTSSVFVVVPPRPFAPRNSWQHRPPQNEEEETPTQTPTSRRRGGEAGVAAAARARAALGEAGAPAIAAATDLEEVNSEAAAAADSDTAAEAEAETDVEAEIAPAAPEAPAAPAAPTSSEAAQAGASCRICMDDEDSPINRLFSPCLCRGTMRHVHVDCLNAWRLHSAAAEFKCQQCGFEYRIARTHAATMIRTYARPAPIAAVLMLLGVLALTLAADALGLHAPVLELLFGRRGALSGGFRLGSVRMPEFAAFYAPGVALLAVPGAAAHLYDSVGAYWHLREHINFVDVMWEDPNVLFVGGSLFSMAASNTLPRAILVVGALASFRLTAKAVHRVTTRLIQTTQEMILQVHA